jgi:hypothetical protein
MHDALANIARESGRLAALEALRDRLAREIDGCDNPRDLPALALRFTDVLSQIDDMPQSGEVSRADEIAARRATRRDSGAPRKARAAKRTS